MKMIEKSLENYDNKNVETKDFYQIEEDIINILSNQQDSILELNEILDELENSPKLKDNRFLKVSYLSPNLIFEVINNWKKEKIIYNLDTNSFQENVDRNISLVPKKLEKWQNLLSAMEEIFSENDKEKFWELNDLDKLKVDTFNKDWLNLKGKTLREIQVIFRENLKELDSLQVSFNDAQKKDFLRQQKRYLEIFMWVWDKYEWWASYLVETRNNFLKISENIVYNSSLSEIFLYMLELHQKIDDNNYQSTSVERSYKILMETINSLLLERLKKENASDKDFVNFSKIITWRNEYKNWSFTNIDIDDNLRNPELATESLMFIFTRKGWMFEKMNIKNLDTNLKNTKVENKISELDSEIKKHDLWFETEVFLQQINFSDLLRNKDKNYEQLDFESQTKLSILNNLIKKLKAKRSSWIKVSISSEKNNFLTILWEVSWDYIEQLNENIEELFSSDNVFDKTYWTEKTSEDFKLTWIHKEAFDLFMNMNWVWLLTISDSWINILKQTWKITWVLTASILAAILTWWTSLIAQWAVAWAVWSASSWAFMPKWYDTVSEMWTDLSSDLALWTVTWAAWWKLTSWWINRFWKIWQNWIRDITRTQSSIINWTDIFALWLAPEFARSIYIDKIFHNQNMIFDSKDDNLNSIYKNLENQERQKQELVRKQNQAYINSVSLYYWV